MNEDPTLVEDINSVLADLYPFIVNLCDIPITDSNRCGYIEGLNDMLYMIGSMLEGNQSPQNIIEFLISFAKEAINQYEDLWKAS